MNRKKNVFISHHHQDDAQVDKLTALLRKNGCEIRNSSIRAKPANQERLKNGLVKDSTIRRLLRMKIAWAGTVIVLVGKDTHSRPWVNWEVEEAHKKGKRIIGVYENGLKDKVEIPPSLNAYATAQVGWNSSAIIEAIEGTSTFQEPDGSLSPRRDGHHEVC